MVNRRNNKLGDRATKWISIQKKFPEHGIGVLVTDGDIITCAELTSIKPPSWTGHGWVGYEWEFGFNEDDITHWMPLPDPPKKGQ
jgi:hypothetical protein